MHRVRHSIARRDQLAVAAAEPSLATQRRVAHAGDQGEDRGCELFGAGPLGVGAVPFERCESLTADAVPPCLGHAPGSFTMSIGG